MAAHFEDRDNGYQALVKRVFGIRRPAIAVGILSGQGAEDAHPRVDGIGEALTVVQVAVFNEFGTYTQDGRQWVPSRSFIRAWFDENEAELRRTLTVLMRAVVAGRLTRDQALKQMAALCIGQVQARIARGIHPPNAAVTVARKGSSTPLINTGVMRASVSSRIEER